MANRIVKIYPAFERLWHWLQMALILALLFTGLALNGVVEVMPFKQAATLHVIFALALMVLWVFALFWAITTGNWRQFAPTSKGLISVLRYYLYGVFRGETHPHRKMYWRKLNPLQVMAYFMLSVVVFPIMWISGLLYLTFNFWESTPDATYWLTIVANLHLLVAYVIIVFVIVHVYMLTFTSGFFAHLKPMIGGFEEVDLEPEQEGYLESNEPWRLKG